MSSVWNVGKFRRNITFKGGHGRGWNAAGNKYFQGGAVGAYSDVRFENCDFIQNGAADETAFAPSIRGGGLRNHGVGYFVNCTFFRNVGNQWGAQIDGRADNYYVNCTFVGGVAKETKEGNPCGGVLACYAVGNFLNCVGAYFMNATGGFLKGVNAECRTSRRRCVRRGR